VASQLEVVRFRDVIPVTGALRLLSGFDVPTIEIKGKDFRNVDQVLINASPSPEFIIVNKSTIYAQLPSTASAIRSIEVTRSTYSQAINAAKLTFQIGDKTHLVSGIQKLVQLFVKWILQSPGSDVFNPERGGGLQEVVGQITSSKNMGPVLGVIIRAVSVTTTQIRAAQINVRGLPLDERLLSAEVVDLKVYDQQAEARAQVKLQSVAGPEAVAEIGL
jgi:hypothetical protein